MTKRLGKVKRIKLRDIWKKEDKNFTRWLAEAENLEDLGEAIGMSLELEGTEVKVGSFSADIVCKNNSDKSLVVIENQLEKTDHDHLGKVITYGAGLDSLTMIWVTPKFRKEHLAALKWLNENTNDNLQFFGIEIELLKIGDSLPAPKFNLVVHPKNLRKSSLREGQKKSKGDLSPLEVLRKRYWQGLEKHMANAGSKLTGQTPSHWQSQCFNIGRSGAAIFAKIYVGENKIRIEIDLNERKTAKAFFHLLYKDKKDIEKELCSKLDWQELPRQVHSSIGLNIENQNIKDEKKWAEQYEVIRLGVESFHIAFAERIRDINLDDWNPDAPK